MIVVLISGALDSGQSTLISPEDLLEKVNLEAESSWQSIYIQDQKIGYANSILKPLQQGGYEISEFSLIEGAMMGTQQSMRLWMSITADSALALVDFEGEVDAGAYSTSYEGRVSDMVLSVKVTTSGNTIERFFPAPEPIYLSQVIKPLIQSGKFNEGDSLKLAGFDPISMKMQDMFIIGGEKSNKEFDGLEIPVRKLTTTMAGLSSVLYVDNHGNTVAEYGPMGMTLKQETSEQALDMGSGIGDVDFLSLFSIKPIGIIKDPRNSTKIHYKVSGVPLELITSASDRQKIIDDAEDLIEVSIDPEPSLVNEDEFVKYTSDAPLIECRDQKIIDAAVLAVTGCKDRLDSLNHLSDWVFNNVKKKLSAGIPSALAVLITREGDCNEHSTLFIAMARAVGIPAKMQLGVVYQDGRFYYHAWTAAWVDKRWIEFEPTFGLERADAARIALASGDLSNAIDLAGAIGQIEIEIIDSLNTR
jgi:hypothetical protein